MMISLLVFTFITVASAQIIIYGSNIPPRNPNQDFIIFGNAPQQAISIGNKLPQQATLPPPPPPPPFISQPSFPQIPQQPILGGNLPSMFVPVSNPNPPQQINFGGNQPNQAISSGGSTLASGGTNADGAFGNSEYHYSWLHDGNKEYDQAGALRYCSSLGGGWKAIALETLDESFFAQLVVNSHKKKYLWTSGVRDGSGWKWINGGAFAYNNWSFTGGKGQTQPDNREGNENCLAILNNIYRDGLKWHDVACHHTKPVICERSAQQSF